MHAPPWAERNPPHAVGAKSKIFEPLVKSPDLRQFRVVRNSVRAMKIGYARVSARHQHLDRL
jgi:hypothetical protein